MNNNIIRQRTEHRTQSTDYKTQRIENGLVSGFWVPGSQKGFTLIELMVVMIILTLLAALVVPKMLGKEKKAKQQAAYAQIALLGTALDLYAVDVGPYPTTAEGLQALIEKPGSVEEWNGPYLAKSQIPADPWGHAYHYESPGKHGDYDLYSYGADDAEGGDGDNQDIVNWK